MTYTPRYTKERVMDEYDHFHSMYGGIGDVRRVFTNRNDAKIFARLYVLWSGRDIPKGDSPRSRHDQCVFQVSSRDLRKDGSFIEGSYKNHGVVLVPMGPEWEGGRGLEEAIRSADGDFFIHFRATFEAGADLEKIK